MKKILFLTLLFIALSYPALTIMAQEVAKDMLEEVLMVDETDTPNNVSADIIVAQAPNESEPNDVVINNEIDVIADDMVVETPSSVVVVEDEDTINVIKPRNPNTDVIVIETPPVDNELEVAATPMDTAIIDTDNASTTHPQLNLTPDKSEMIRLSEKAASVIVGNPNHISVLLDTPDTIIVVPRMQGASHFSVIGENGKVIMQRHVVVGAPADDYVRIRRSCNNGDANCQQTSVYYCPNTCHEVVENTQQGRRR